MRTRRSVRTENGNTETQEVFIGCARHRTQLRFHSSCHGHHATISCSRRNDGQLDTAQCPCVCGRHYQF
ncbi:hypothetical protein EV363DRAFT_1161063 [Boletus edulis]|uniref:Uncharacterized protein n=1 Tax=Boletus edulis BED1 TaxID=1328754 RepID=A0AAD4G550_BOLED|nr:hypothetical protein EV363DRAFT_1161063 [Boletus edulis]KAF8414479.1 hypothetical protein L210DRAFT_3592532 [Boletus edulis BED1]KAF8414480.1 hypothetical protein L210DRAFT_3592534 [Boletus edulis BED1]KAF8444913.1 hypothetical protein L210DRAFT_3531380 [Boletus edulis BED1]KAF8444914.1 hypothetical protein L210DRAFT_3531382 [Boletus edulis BED1]